MKKYLSIVLVLVAVFASSLLYAGAETASQLTATAEAITVSRTAANSFTVYGDAEEYNWFAIGY